MPIFNIQYYTSIIPASHKDMNTQKPECMLAEKKIYYLGLQVCA